jgi:RNA polymerase sigma-70 factor (ECF subfamily)
MDADQKSITRILDNDVSGLKELMQRYKDSVYRMACRYMGNAEDAAEITEDVFFRVYEKASRYKAKASVKTWIFTIAANMCKDALRRRKKHRNVSCLPEDESMDSFASPADTPAEEQSRKEMADAIEKSIHELPHKLRFPFVFCILEENSYRECARVLNCSEKTIEMRIYRARLQLRESLSKVIA